MAMEGLDLGPCQILFGTAGAEADIGESQGNVVVNFNMELADLKSDQFGTLPKDQVITGLGASVVVPMAEYTLENLARALNQSVKRIDEDKGFWGGTLVGTKLSDKAQSLLLKKYVDGVPSTDTNDWVRFPKAAPSGSISISFGASDQRIIETTFTAFPDASNRLYVFGDETAATSGS